MKRSLVTGILTVLCMTLGVAVAGAQEPTGNMGIRGGVGTDISGGIASGAQIDWVQFQGKNAFELGLAIFFGSFEEDSNNGFNDYHEVTDVFVVGALANYLINYSMDTAGPYFVVGAGVGAFSVEWSEESPTDTSLGTLLPGGGSKQEEDGTNAGLLINFGIGKRFSEVFDMRFQVPTFFISSGDERDGAVVPTFTITAGFRFGTGG